MALWSMVPSSRSHPVATASTVVDTPATSAGYASPSEPPSDAIRWQVVLAPRSPDDGVHALEPALSGVPCTVLDPGVDADPAWIHALRSGDRLAIVEGSALLPSGWRDRAERHFAGAKQPDVLAACTNLAGGPERLEAEQLPRRSDPSAWQGVADALELRWRGTREDVAVVSSPLLVLRDGAALRPNLLEWWRNGATTLSLPPSATLSIAHDLATRREPGRTRLRLSAQITDSLLPTEAQAPSAAVRLASVHTPSQSQDHPRLHALLARDLTRIGDTPGALEHAATALARWPRHVETQLWQVQAWIRSGEAVRARRSIESLQQEIPLGRERKAHLLACLGELWRLGGDGFQAEQCLDRALALDPLQPLALDARGLIELESGRFEGSIRFFRQAVRSDPYFAAAWSDAGRALAMSGQLETARTALGRALALYSGNREARRLLARISPPSTTGPNER